MKAHQQHTSITADNKFHAKQAEQALLKTQRGYKYCYRQHKMNNYMLVE